MNNRATSGTAVISQLIAFSVPSIISRLANIFAEVAVTFFVAKLGIIILATYGLATPLFLTIYRTFRTFLDKNRSFRKIG
ncbi:MAG: hypothetical protein GY821_15195 [Gammaproteobacteria bacterium]|nr:hypothetical protein [Gammaproteobacteria bacterium]